MMLVCEPYVLTAILSKLASKVQAMGSKCRVDLQCALSVSVLCRLCVAAFGTMLCFACCAGWQPFFCPFSCGLHIRQAGVL